MDSQAVALPTDATAAPIFIFAGRGRGKPWMASDAELLVPDLVEAMRATTSLDPVEACRRQTNDLQPLAVADPLAYLFACAYGLALTREGVEPQGVAGYSLGEYAALVVANAIDFETGLELVRARAGAIGHAMRTRPLRLVRVVGVEAATVAAMCAEHGDVWPATFDGLDEGIVVGPPEALDRLAPKLRRAGARQLVLAMNDGGLHTPPMREARDAMIEVLAEVKIRSPEIPIASSVSGRLEPDPGRWQELLADQVHAPVRWHECLSALPADAPLLEVGPSARLAELALRADPGRAAFVVDSIESLHAVSEQLGAPTPA